LLPQSSDGRIDNGIAQGGALRFHMGYGLL
jgi:hypothetical protein